MAMTKVESIELLFTGLSIKNKVSVPSYLFVQNTGKATTPYTIGMTIYTQIAGRFADAVLVDLLGYRDGGYMMIQDTSGTLSESDFESFIPSSGSLRMISLQNNVNWYIKDSQSTLVVSYAYFAWENIIE